VSRGTQDLRTAHRSFPYWILTISDAAFQQLQVPPMLRFCGSYNPDMVETISVWAPPVSLATTPGISFDFFLSNY
jgi:hypothetical protein